MESSNPAPADPPPIFDAAFVCGGCGRLAVIPKCVFISGAPSADDSCPSGRRKAPEKTDPPEIELYRDVSLWQYQTNFSLLKGDFASKSFHQFPLCHDCEAAQCKYLTSERRFYDSQSQYFSKILAEGNTDKCEEMEKLVQRVQQEASVLEEVMNMNSREVAKLASATTPAEVPEAGKRRMKPQRKVPHVKPAIPLGFNGVGMCLSFHISFNRIYGCINGYRIGTRTPDIVPEEEIDLGFHFLAQLARSLGVAVGVDVSSLTVGVGVVLTDERGADPIVLTSYDFKDRRSIQRFGNAIRRFMAVCWNIFEAPAIVDSGSVPPHTIDLESDTISEQSYLYDRKNPSRFTTAMKWLLFNFKYIQRHAYLTTMSQYEESSPV